MLLGAGAVLSTLYVTPPLRLCLVQNSRHVGDRFFISHLYPEQLLQAMCVFLVGNSPSQDQPH